MNRHLVIGVAAAIAFVVSVVWAGDSPTTILQQHTIDDFVLLVKFALWSATIFIVILTGIGVAFFGFDVRKARSSITDMTTELKKLVQEAKDEHENLAGLRDKLLSIEEQFYKAVSEAEDRIGQLGAEVETIAGQSEPDVMPSGDRKDPTREQNNPGLDASSPDRSNADLIREIIKNSSFSWTTMLRLMKKTALSREEILEEVRRMRDVEISIGRKTGDQIFRLKQMANQE